jgi:hypothetical protein
MRLLIQGDTRVRQIVGQPLVIGQEGYSTREPHLLFRRHQLGVYDARKDQADEPSDERYTY